MGFWCFYVERYWSHTNKQKNHEQFSFQTTKWLIKAVYYLFTLVAFDHHNSGMASWNSLLDDFLCIIVRALLNKFKTRHIPTTINGAIIAPLISSYCQIS
jgi:hypothetical protein